MRFSPIPTLAASLLLAASAAQAAPSARAEAALARELAGRVAGPPVDCIYLRDIRASRIIDGIAIVYETGGGTLYVNRPASGTTWLHRDDVMVTDTHSPQLCSVDIVRLRDSGSRMETGSVGLGKFVPYRRPAKP